MIGLEALLGAVISLLTLAMASSRLGWGRVEKACHVTLITISLAMIAVLFAAIWRTS